MAQPKRLRINLSPKAISDLDEITSWNTVNNGLEQAIRYREFLLIEIEKLEVDYSRSRKVKRKSELRYVVLRWKPDGYGHVVVFKTDEESETVNIAKLYHTSQNWEAHARRNL